LDDTQVYYSKDRIESCSTGVITVMILFLLIVPVYLLYHLVESKHGLLSQRLNAICIGILLVFTLIFSAIMSLFTAAKKHEILAAAAAYVRIFIPASHHLLIVSPGTAPCLWYFSET
jgi:hypothetical protein